MTRTLTTAALALTVLSGSAFAEFKPVVGGTVMINEPFPVCADLQDGKTMNYYFNVRPNQKMVLNLMINPDSTHYCGWKQAGAYKVLKVEDAGFDVASCIESEKRPGENCLWFVYPKDYR
jgi:hypothetical protein